MAELDESSGDSYLEFDSFYHGFMAPYFDVIDVY